ARQAALAHSTSRHGGGAYNRGLRRATSPHNSRSHRMNRLLITLTLAVAWVIAGAGAMSRAASTDQPLVKNGDLVAIVGDSITEQKLYSVFIEDYLLMCKPAGKDVKTMQFGWGGESS